MALEIPLDLAGIALQCHYAAFVLGGNNKVRNCGDVMLDLQQIIEEREIDVRCWQCGWTEKRTMRWLSSKRHMSCPTCDSVIVLDTGEVRREIMRQRKQLVTLHDQMVELWEPSGNISQRPPLTARPAGPRPVLDLALAHSHPDTVALAARSASMRRPTRG